MTRRYDVDWGTQRLTLAETGAIVDENTTVTNWSVGDPMPSVPKCIGTAAHAWWSCEDVEAAWSALRAHTTDVPAAGGLLTDDAGRLLCIHRIGHWDLPKGKLEAGEALEEAAAREVQEECGVPLPEVLSPFATTYHVYGPDEGLMKVTHWYQMAFPEGVQCGALVPQTEEGITEVRWAAPEEVEQLEPQAFGNIARLMAAWRASR